MNQIESLVIYNTSNTKSFVVQIDMNRPINDILNELIRRKFFKNFDTYDGWSYSDILMMFKEGAINTSVISYLIFDLEQDNFVLVSGLNEFRNKRDKMYLPFGKISNIPFGPFESTRDINYCHLTIPYSTKLIWLDCGKEIIELKTHYHIKKWCNLSIKYDNLSKSYFLIRLPPFYIKKDIPYRYNRQTITQNTRMFVVPSNGERIIIKKGSPVTLIDKYGESSNITVNANMSVLISYGK